MFQLAMPSCEIRPIILLASCLFVCGTPLAAENNSAETLRALVRVQTIQHYTEMGYAIYLRNCQNENPEIGNIISKHRARDSALYTKLDALIAKYRVRIVKDFGEIEARRALTIITDEQQKAEKMLHAATERDESLHHFDCIKDPSTLAGPPAEVRAQIDRLANE